MFSNLGIHGSCSFLLLAAGCSCFAAIFSMGTKISIMAWSVHSISLKQLFQDIRGKMGSSFFILPS